MKKISSLIAAIGLVSAANAFAMVGGPFDGGDYSQALDDTGIYQAAMRFRNGSGFQQWGVNVSLSPTINSGSASGGGGANTVLKIGSYLDRSVIYYKGIVYVGNASGMVDHDRGIVTGVTNSYSALSASSSANNGAGTGNQTVTASTIVVDNGSNQSNGTCNTFFEGKVTAKSPILKFNGSGELSILNPSLSDALNSAVSNLIAAIPTAATQVPSPIAAITTAIGNLINNTFGPGGTNIPAVSNADTTYQNADVVSMKVIGQRVYFLSSR